MRDSDSDHLYMYVRTHKKETLCCPVNIDALPRLLSLLSNRSYCHLGQHGFSDLACPRSPTNRRIQVPIC